MFLASMVILVIYLIEQTNAVQLRKQVNNLREYLIYKDLGRWTEKNGKRIFEVKK
jgi:hypothetical protein